MKLFVVHDYARWGFSVNVVRAESADEARRLVNPSTREHDLARIEVTELCTDGSAAILWCYDESPDSRPERD